MSVKRHDVASFKMSISSSFPSARRAVWFHSCYSENWGSASNLKFFLCAFVSDMESPVLPDKLISSNQEKCPIPREREVGVLLSWLIRADVAWDSAAYAEVRRLKSSSGWSYCGQFEEIQRFLVLLCKVKFKPSSVGGAARCSQVELGALATCCAWFLVRVFVLLDFTIGWPSGGRQETVSRGQTS